MDNPITIDPRMPQPRPPLILVQPDLIIGVAAIKKVTRCGNYTEIELFGNEESYMRHFSVWDDERVLWRRVLEHCSREV